MVKIPALDQLIRRVKEYVGEDSESWKEITELAVCFNSYSNLSHLILASIFLINHCPSGKSGEGYVDWSRIASSLCSPHFRCAITVAASFFPIHRGWAAWTDSRSGLNDKAPFGSRAIELVVFERNLSQEISKITHNWIAALDSASDFINLESERVYKKLKMVQSNGHIHLYWEKEMNEAVSQMIEKAIKYFRDPGQGIGWSTDPYLAPYYASTVLDYLGVNRERVDYHDVSDILEDIP